jgi:peptide/nickel transport system substrate-binding protein
MTLFFARAILVCSLFVPTLASSHAQTIRLAMTLADLPTPNGAPDQGTEGNRFMGYTLYDALVLWDLSRADRAATIRPGLAESWSVDPKDPTKWVFKLRQGVHFHDGSLFNADAVIFNFDKLLDRKSPQYDPAQAGQTLGRIPGIVSWRKLDDYAVEIGTKEPDALLLYRLVWVFMSSPARWQQAGSWAENAKNPSGTGPWMMERYIPRQSALLKRNPTYWDSSRIPASDHLQLLPVPDASTRTAALLSGQVDWIESPAPDTIAALKAAGMQILTGTMPHLWPYDLSRVPGSPLNDLRVRKALNLAIDRDGLVQLLDGLAVPAHGVVENGNPWFGHPTFDIHYDPAEAQRLLAEAGYGPAHKLKLKFMISTSGSGQMYPLPMNEFIQQNFADIGVELSFETLEWQALRTRRDSGGAAGVANKGIDAINNSWNSMDPLGAFLNHVDSHGIPPAGLNWGGINDPEFDSLIQQAENEFDPARQDDILGKINERMVDQAVWIFVVHDVNPRAISPHVKGLVEAQSWFVDFSPVHVEMPK